ncbi:MAG: hypothetical protein LBT12_03780 [Oscillospiraceae bacterium]|jgi:hypothetical protein|nr:hypothetical protein [Oscillospiraceae bacterium]
MEREHVHDEHCNHEHEHVHDESCGHDHNAFIAPMGEPVLETTRHDDAIIVSGALSLMCADPAAAQDALAAALSGVARAVSERDGLVGHIKASFSVTSVDMLSVTDAEATVKSAPEREVKINLAAIVFLIPPEAAEALVRGALDAVKKSVST